MRNRLMITAATAALIAGTSFAYAQGMGGHEKGAGGAGMQQSSPSATGAESHGGSAGMKSTQSEEKGGAANRSAQHEKSGAQKGTVGQSAGEKSVQESGKGEKPKGMSSENEKAPGAKGMKAEGNERKGNMKAEGHEGRENNMKAEGREGRDNNMKAEGREGNKAAETKSTTEKSQTTGQAGAAAKLSTEQRTKITSVIRNEHVKSIDKVNFSISVGTRVPREGVTFYSLPTEVVTIYPEWRGYKYILVRDEIIVVDPNTYEIVAVLNA
jgi:hypothetical protein